MAKILKKKGAIKRPFLVGFFPSPFESGKSFFLTLNSLKSKNRRTGKAHLAKSFLSESSGPSKRKKVTAERSMLLNLSTYRECLDPHLLLQGRLNCLGNPEKLD